MDGGRGWRKGTSSLWVWTVAFWGVSCLPTMAVLAPHHLGRDFIVAFMQNGLQQTLNSDFKLLLTAYSPSTSITISMKKPRLRMTVQATTGQTVAVKIPPQAEMVGSKAFDNTVLVQATNDISVLMVNEKPASGDSAVVYPVHSLGTEYYVVTPNVGTDRYGEFVIAAWDKPTTVDVHLKASVTYQGRTYPRGSVLPLHLEAFQAAQFQSPSDMSGTRIVAQKPVAVYAGHTCLARFTQCDHLAEQLQPVSSWGSTFIVPPLPFEAQSDIVYVSTAQATRMESQHGTTRTIRELRPARSALYGLQAPNSLYLSANAGVQVIFFADGGHKDTLPYEPFFMTIPDVSSYCHSYVIFSQDHYENYAVMIAKTAETASIMLNKSPLRNVVWKPVPGTDYAWAGHHLGRRFAVHMVESEASPFGLLSVGIGEQKAYGSAAICDSDPCRGVQCRAKETCKVQDGRASCVHDYLGTCLGLPDLQYRTFDGATVAFQADCTYTVVKYCGSDPALVPFAIDERKSEGGSKGWLTSIYVYGYNVSIHKGDGGKVQVNEQLTSLPTSLEAGKIEISQNEGRTILQTDFGLQVTYDEDLALMVALPSSYFGVTCGLCGNFNEDTDDEMMLPNGTQASSVEEWVDSWRDPTCWDYCGGQCPKCDQEQRQVVGDSNHCGMMDTAAEGPFAACRAQVSPEDYVTRCIFEVCSSGGDPQALCRVLETYAAACKEHGVIVPGWKEPAGCARSCPENSHFEACGTACPATCAAPQAPVSCSQPCTESCQCDEGFVLNSGVCIPAKSCSCIYNGRSYKPGQEFWEDGTCRSHCRCDTGQGKVICKKASCKVHEKCTSVDGVHRCVANKYSTCIGTGDPHYTTFDGLRYDFQGTCVYQFAALCTEDPALVPFQVTVENNNRGSKAVSFTKTVTLEVYGNVITLSQEYPRKIKVNGVFVELPFSQEGQFTIYTSGVHGFIRTNFDMRVSFDWYSYARVIVPQAYAGAICGLCGNADGDPDNDFITPDGRQLADPVQFADSWKVADVPGCSAGCVGDCPVCNEEQKKPYHGDQYCGVLARAGGPFAACHAAVNPTPFIEDCAFDACQYKGHRDTLCSAIAAYVTACQSQGVQLEKWRTPDFCSPVCPRNSHYELCGTGCPATCRGPGAAEGCDVPCAEGCFCDAGFVLSGDECVAVGECGCEHRGRYYKLGEDFYTGKSCQERCICQPGGVVACRETSCGPHEECRVERGALGCHAAGYGRLVVAGDPHHVTFDGRAFHLRGSCAYVLVRVCKPDPRLANFSVLLENHISGQPNVVLMKKVVISVHGYTVTMERGQTWEVTMDGERYMLPLATGDNKLRISQEGSNIVLDSASGLQLLYNTASYLLVTIPSSYQGRVCGLGGNYNGEKDDDFRLPNGAITQSMEEFVASWKVPTEDGACTDGCGTNCPVCDATNTAPFRAGDSCGLIQDPLGPFGTCHPQVSPVEYFNHCLYDMCAANGTQDTLCQSLQAYTAACQAAGAKIDAWRTASFCPLSCPPNSHYELCTRSCDFTCASLSVAAPCGRRCFEGCQCDDGFLFDGATCVSVERCGCVHKGRYLKAAETIVSNNCTTRCTCHPARGLRCEDTRCRPDEVCTTRDRMQQCVQREGHCRVSRGATMATFDGATGKLPGSGTYKMAALCDERSPAWFKVVVEVGECRGDGVPAGAAVFVFFRDALVTLNADMEAWVNGIFTRPPATVSKAVSLSTAAGNVTISHSSGVQVLFSPGGEVTVTVGAHLAGQLCAPCGNFNGNANDDLMLPNGRAARSLAEVVDAWRAKDFAGCRISDRRRNEVEAPVYPEQ
ncbi:IgGFc-binding protein isoform X2 [Struthio camelus]|uniref:IgGFc-binding protein isoform X2 n=1 Tax=Struthio camelus TaxID=8801 RepID=UPI003603B0DA